MDAERVGSMNQDGKQGNEAGSRVSTNDDDLIPEQLHIPIGKSLYRSTNSTCCCLLNARTE